jgi:hypothetical protein
VVADTVRKLKTEEARKISSYTRDDEDEQRPAARKITRQTNIFKR